MRTLTRGPRPHQRRQHRHRPERRPRNDPDVGLIRHPHKPIVIQDRLDLTSPGIERDPMRRQIPIRARRPIPADRTEHDRRVDLLQPLLRETPLVQEPRPHCLDDHIRLGDEFGEHLHPLRGLQIQDQRLLATIHTQMHQRHAIHDRPRHLTHIITRRRLDLDHLRPEIDEMRRERGGAEQRQVEDANAREQTLASGGR